MWTFNPSFLTELRLKQALVATIAPVALQSGRCLDVGCGDRPYEYLFATGGYMGVDVENSGRPLSMKQPDYFYDGKTLPFDADSFDIVLSTQVLEHVPNPQALLTEMARVCKPDGMLIVSLPFIYQEHEEPFDYFRFTSFGVTELLEKAGLTVVHVKKDTSALEALAVLLSVYVMHNLVPRIKGLGRLYALFFCFPIQVLALGLSKILPDKGQLYLNLVVLAKKV